jgi:uncharacterized protein
LPLFRRFRAYGLALGASALFIACASPRALVRDLQKLFAQEKYAEAADRVAAAKLKNYGEKNALLYYLDLGMTSHLAGRYARSNEAFESAKRVAQELYTKSVTKEASTFLISDNVRPYAGEDFERALIHVFSALNYLFLEQGAEALVEVRQADYLLTKLQTDFGHKNVYTEDAFIRYLGGMIYESQGETNDAFIAYRKALEAYEGYRKHYGVSAPDHLVKSALRAAAAMGFSEEAAALSARWKEAVPAAPPPDTGEVVVLHYAGLPPYKVDSFFEIGFLAGWGYVEAQRPAGEEQEKVEQANAIARSILASDVVRMAFPKYVRAAYTVHSLDAAARGAGTAHRAQVAEDIGAIAVKNLEDRIVRVRAKTIARAVVKFALARKLASKVEEKQGAGAAWVAKALLQAAAAATELSDKRCWQTLPDKIAVASVVLPAGKHTLDLTFRDAGGAAVRTKTSDVEVKAGRKTFLVVRTTD